MVLALLVGVDLLFDLVEEDHKDVSLCMGAWAALAGHSFYPSTGTWEGPPEEW